MKREKEDSLRIDTFLFPFIYIYSGSNILLLFLVGSGGGGGGGKGGGQKRGGGGETGTDDTAGARRVFHFCEYSRKRPWRYCLEISV